MTDEPGARKRALKCGVVAMLLALALWELAFRDFQREFSEQPGWYTPLGLVLVLLGGLSGGFLFGYAPKAQDERPTRRFGRWVRIMFVVVLPSAVFDLVRAASLATGAWTLALPFGLAFTAWFIEQRLQSYVNE